MKHYEGWYGLLGRDESSTDASQCARADDDSEENDEDEKKIRPEDYTIHCDTFLF